MAKPRIYEGPASAYEHHDEIIREFGDGRSGGLVSIRRDRDGKLVVDVYRTDSDVLVRHVSSEH